MIGFLKGEVLDIETGTLILDVNGIGLELIVKDSMLVKLGDTLSLFIDTVVRDDGIYLYAFSTRSEKQLFRLLYSIKDIGPKMALSIVDNFSIDRLRDIIMTENIPALTVVPRLGKKTAERLIFELKRKADKLWAGVEQNETGLKADNRIYTDVKLALQQLGYSAMQAETMFRTLLRDKTIDINEYTVSELVKMVLQQRIQ